MDRNDVTFEQIKELMNMLTGGELPEGMIMVTQPKLSREQAFSAIWFLQEHLCVLPDHFEMCNVCGDLFDTRHDGFTVDGTDVPGLWHEENNVTQEMLKRYDGFNFCSMGCEYHFWLDCLEKQKTEPERAE